ncbi:TonB-dependent receptor, partial [Caulobacter sp. AP07]|uniref:TonB-dependent receptor n=1 Tax=Caulobacter sp. AP07 TaxID=1144304 RepID=UPI001EE672F9
MSKATLVGASSFLTLALCGAASAAARTAEEPMATAAAVAAPAGEQAAAPRSSGTTVVDEVIVTGLRGSLQRNLDIKRTSAGVVDAISAEDIGKFPDSNVAASLQRLPGVSIQRAGARGEPQGITVRGFAGDFNETLYDGRRISTATGGRSVDFSTVGADFVGGLSVLKTPDVSLSSSSIGATVNVAFPKPFDHPGRRMAVTASGSLQDDSGKFVPTVGALFSDTFADNRFGVLVDAMYTRHDTQTNRVFVSGWPGGRYAPCQLTATCTKTELENKTILGWFEQQAGASQIYTKDERIDGRIALQWAPVDGVTVTLDDNYSRQTIRADNFGYGIWFNQENLRNVKLDQNGTTVDFAQGGSQTDFVAGTDRSVLQTNQTGLNVQWDVSDNLKFEADGSYAKSWLNPGGEISSDNADVGYGFDIGPALGISIGGDSKNTLPVLHSYGPNGDAARWADTAVIGSHVTVRQAQENTDVVKQLRFAGSWEQEGFRIKAGGSYLEDHYKFQNSNTFANNYWQAYSGYGSPSGNHGGVLVPASLFTGRVSTNNFIPGFDGALPPYLLKFDAHAYQQYLTSLGNPQTKNIPGFNYGAGTVGTQFTGAFDLALDNGSIRDITEKTWALFVKANFDVDVAGMPFHFNAGVREESSRITSKGFGQVPIEIRDNAGDPTLLTVRLSDAQAVTTKSNYSYLLPSIDLKLELTESIHLRLDASRTLTRPGLNLLTPVLSVGTGQRVGALTASGGSPALK